MNRRHTVTWAVLLALLAAFLWWLNRPTPPVPTVERVPSPPTPATPQPTPQGVVTPLVYEVPSKGKYQGMGDPRWKWWKDMENRDPAFEWKMPIDFWGKVVDQDGRPVPRAKVRYGWNSTNGSNERFEESNAQGLFSITGITGKFLSVKVEKEYYHARGGLAGQGFEYAAFFEGDYHEPDPENPVIFRLIKKLEAEPLIVGRINNLLQYDQGPYYYDLERGKISRQPPSNVGLKFILQRSASPQGQPFDWTWTVKGVNALVQTTEDEFPQMAPTDGYASQWQESQSANAAKFQQDGAARLYVQTVENQYAVVDLKLAQPNLRHVGPNLGVKSFFNPKAGSRILEYDPAKTVTNP